MPRSSEEESDWKERGKPVEETEGISGEAVYHAVAAVTCRRDDYVGRCMSY